jgi:hypothetical protein
MSGRILGRSWCPVILLSALALCGSPGRAFATEPELFAQPVDLGEAPGGPELGLPTAEPDAAVPEPREARLHKPQTTTDSKLEFWHLTSDDVSADQAIEDRGLLSDAPAVPSKSDAELTPELAALRDKVHQVLALYYPRHQNVRRNTPWEVMHAIIAYGVDTQLFKGTPDGEKVNAVGWMCYNNPCGGEQMLLVDHGKIDARRGPGVQGHAGQFLAILAQSKVKADYPLHVNGKDFTLTDLIEHEKETCVSGEELTFKLIALMHYLDSDETWTTRDGQEWSIQRLVREELKQPIRGAACGGTHRLMGFSYAVNKRMQRGQPMVGEFRRAQKFVQDYHRYTFSLQNRDGSFSTEWFARRGDNPDIDRRLKTSGHILEWIAFSLSAQELRDPRTIKAVDQVATILLKNNKHNWEIGPLGHGLHALSIYNSRVFEDSDAARPQNIVELSPAKPAREARRPSKAAE